MWALMVLVLLQLGVKFLVCRLLREGMLRGLKWMVLQFLQFFLLLRPLLVG